MKIYIPICPPGINETYKVGKSGNKGHLYKSARANKWAEDAGLIIGAEAGKQEWKDTSKYYSIYIRFSNFRQDVDAPIKLVIDTVTAKLGFDDKRIVKQCSEKINYKEKEGVWISLEPYNV